MVRPSTGSIRYPSFAARLSKDDRALQISTLSPEKFLDSRKQRIAIARIGKAI